MANIPLDLPDFNGQVRLMAVAWQANRVGSANIDMIVRDALIAEPLLPRFLAPGDETRLAILLQNLDLPAGPATVKLSLEGPLALAGDAQLSAPLDPGQQIIRTTTLRATGAGRGVIRLDVTGPAGFHVQRETAILIRPARPPITVATSGELAPNAETRLTPALAQMIPGTATATLRVGGPVRYDVAALVKALAAYPMLCLEQASSKGFPLALLPDRDPARLQASVYDVLDKQRFDGGFGLWSANNESETWLSAYATEFLLRARTAGAAVPESALTDALKFLADNLENLPTTPEGQAARAYYLYDLAAAGQPRAGANRLLAEDLDKLPTPLAKAQLAAAAALSNDRPRAETAFLAALASPARKDWDADRGSALRDQLATAVLLKESGLLPDRLNALIAQLPGADLKPQSVNTQEAAWAVAAASVLGRNDRPAAIAIDGAPIPPAQILQRPLTTPVTLRNLGDRPIWQTLSTTGIPTDPAPAARQSMRVTRKFFTTAGAPLDLDNLKQNTVFILLVEGRADDAQDHRALMIQALPAGWEIAGRLQAGKTAGMPWLGDLTELESEPAADDRYAATISLTKDKPDFRAAVRLRAVTPGTYELPGATLEDMYRPAIFARQNTGRLKIQANE